MIFYFKFNMQAFVLTGKGRVRKNCAHPFCWQLSRRNNGNWCLKRIRQRSRCCLFPSAINVPALESARPNKEILSIADLLSRHKGPKSRTIQNKLAQILLSDRSVEWSTNRIHLRFTKSIGV